MEKETVIVSKSNNKTITLNIEGMVCKGCEENINHSVINIEGITQVNTSYNDGVSANEFDTIKTNISAIKKIIQSKGYVIKDRNNE